MIQSINFTWDNICDNKCWFMMPYYIAGLVIICSGPGPLAALAQAITFTNAYLSIGPTFQKYEIFLKHIFSRIFMWNNR